MVRDNQKDFTAPALQNAAALNHIKISERQNARSRRVLLSLSWSLRLCILAFVSLFLLQSVEAEETSPSHVKVGIEEKLGQYIPLDLKFKDENGNDITLRQISNGKPLIIDMAYFECPGICDVVMAGIKKMIDNTSQVPGRDFDIVTISFNSNDNPKIAREKKAQFWRTLDRTIPSDAWRFLTGDSAAIHGLTNSLGFYFMKDKYGRFTHPTGLIVVDKDGKIVRYIQGTTFALANVEMALREAQAGSAEQIIGSTPQVCFSREPSGALITDDVLRAGGVGTLVFMAGFVVFLRRKKSQKNQEKAN
jgi:protein SCO1